ncbi:MAG TPA: DPP IV N-terminal domain-containing protein [Chloroflexota bacterium]|nr:DPP IV N-terminal domain-containing protein [Chloroflexota bacterium]
MALIVASIAIVVGVILSAIGLHLIGGGNAPAAPATAVVLSQRDVLQPLAVTDTPAAPASPTSAPSPSAPAASPTARVTPSPVAPALPGGTIVFTSENPVDRSLYAISPTGQNLRRLAAGDAHNPSCSPDGETVAFESSRAGGNFVYVQRLDGAGTPVVVTKGPGSDQLATWSPDGKTIAFSRAKTNNTAIFTITLASHQEHQLTSGEGGDWRMSYAPDGRRIVFTSTRTGDNELWLMNADGTNAHQLTTGPGDKRDSAWSPDGKWIAFRSDRDGHHWDLYKVSPDNGQIVRLTDDAIDKGFPNWSPDSRWILFTAKRGDQPEVYVMPVDGGDWIPITSPPTIGGGATWCRA